MITIGTAGRFGTVRRRYARNGYRSLVAAVVVVLALIASWAALAPAGLGGGTTYVVTEGVSMLPHFRAGDLVLLRAEPSYHVGEVAAYHNAELHEVVMHRIIAVSGGHYVFKGDNNDFVDAYEPTKPEIVGAEWLHVKGAGKLVDKLRDPLVAAVLLGSLWVVSCSRRPRSRHQRRRHRNAY